MQTKLFGNKFLAGCAFGLIVGSVTVMLLLFFMLFKTLDTEVVNIQKMLNKQQKQQSQHKLNFNLFQQKQHKLKINKKLKSMKK